VDPLGIIQDPFGQGRFPGIDVGTDTDISDFGYIFFHCSFTFMGSLSLRDPDDTQGGDEN